MSEKKSYTVLRAMQGDREYARGDTRELTEADAAALVASGALVEKGKEPAEREPAVVHTFGNAPSAVNEGGYTTPTGEGVTPGRPAVTTDRKPGRAKDQAKA